MATRAQKEALERLRADQKVNRVLWPRDADSPRFLYGQLSRPANLKPESIVDRFLARYGAIYGIGRNKEHRVVRIKQDSAGNRHVDIERVAGGIRVYPTRMSFWIDATGSIKRIKAHWPSVPPAAVTKPRINAQRALRAAASARRDSKLLGFATRPTLEYRIVRARRAPALVLAWNFVASFSGRRPATEGFVVSAMDGALLLRYPDEDEVASTASGIGINDIDETAASPARTLDVDDPGGGSPLTLLDSTRTPNIQTEDMAAASDYTISYSLCADTDGDGAFNDITNVPRSDSNRPEVDAHFNTGLIHDYFARAVSVNAIDLFGRNGWNDDVAQRWISRVHYDTDSESSAFTRTYRITYHGDGDGEALTYKPTLDTCTHEWAHAVQMTDVTGGVNPSGGFDGDEGENFVLKEAMADMFAASLSRDSGWRMGAVFEDDAAMAGATHESTGLRLRGLRSPSDFDQPDHYQPDADTSGDGFAGTTEDYTRIGILDKAAFLIAMGGSHPSSAADPVTYPPIDVYGLGVAKFENILYYTLNQLSGPADVFADFRQDMIDAAEVLYPGECESSTVVRAFDAVGIYEGGATITTPPARPSGPDPMITPWGARTDTTPYWQTPDIYVLDAAGSPAAPMKLQVNRLIARVTNIGDADAIGVSVAFSFAPYGAGTSNNTTKAIDTVTVDVPSGTAVEAEVAWDLTDITDTNGGTWPLPLGDFNHFCVKVELTHADDVDSCNNNAQNNFGDVVDANGDADGSTAFIIGNARREPRWVALVPDPLTPRNWKFSIDVTSAVRDRGQAFHSISRGAQPALPWTGRARGAVLIPMLGNEIVAATLRWTRSSLEQYDGPAQGRVVATSSGRDEAEGDFRGEILELRLLGDELQARVRGVIRHRKRRGKWRAKRHATLARGLLTGHVDRRSGRFEGTFSGSIRHRGKAREAKLLMKGRLAASAMLSAALHDGDDVQGIDLGVPLVGNNTALLRELRHSHPLARPRRWFRAGKRAARRQVR